MKLDRLKELISKPNMDAVETGEYLALVRELLPGLLRVCDAYMEAAEHDAIVDGCCRDVAITRVGKKLEELLG